MNLQNQITYLDSMDLPGMFSGASVPAPLDLEGVLSSIVKRCGLLIPQYSEPETMRELTTLWFKTNRWQFDHLVKMLLAEYSPIENTDRYSDHAIKRSDDGIVSYSGSDIRISTNGGKDVRALALGGTDTRSTSQETEGSGSTTHSGSDVRNVEEGGSDVRGLDTGGSDTETGEAKKSAYNSSAYEPDTQNTGTTTYGRTEDETTTYGHTTDDTLTHGEVIDQEESSSASGTDATVYGKTEDETTTYGRTQREETKRGTKETRSGSGGETYTEHTHGNIGVTTNQQMLEAEADLLWRFNAYDWIAAKYERDMMIQVY